MVPGTNESVLLPLIAFFKILYGLTVKGRVARYYIFTKSRVTTCTVRFEVIYYPHAAGLIVIHMGVNAEISLQSVKHRSQISHESLTFEPPHIHHAAFTGVE